VRAFYDIDTPITLAALERDGTDYLTAAQVARYDLYLSFTGGPMLDRLRDRFGASRPRAFYCLVDVDAYAPVETAPRWDLGYLGTYSPDRQPPLQSLLLDAARAEPDRRYAVAGPQYPAEIIWPDNIDRVEHVAPGDHPAFYCAQRYTLNITRADMRRAGWSPSVRLFEAAACGVPVISDRWPGLAELFKPDDEILLADDTSDVLAYLAEIPDRERRSIGNRARRRVLSEHTATHRAQQLEAEVDEIRLSPARRAA
jgi:spore maturation protein CgeB